MPKRQAQRIIDNRSANRNPTTISGITLTSPGTAYTAGDGLTLTGVVLAVGAGDGISIAADAVAVDSTVVRTTRTVTAGSGLTGGGALSADLTLNVGAGTLITVGADTVGITTGANYQYIGTGSGTAAAWQNLSGLAGAGLTHSAGVFAVGAGSGITVNADDVALTTPGTLTAATSNTATGNHTHAITTGAASTLTVATSNATGSSASLARADHLHTITTSSNPDAASILASTASGGLTLQSLAVQGSVDITNGGDLTVAGSGSYAGSNVLFVDSSGGNVGIMGTPDPQFALDIWGPARAEYWIGPHALQIADALMICHYDGRYPFATNFTGEPNGHQGQVGTATGGVLYRAGKFGKALQIASATTNYFLDPSCEYDANLTQWSDYASSGAFTSTRSTEVDPLFGLYAAKIVGSASTAGLFYQSLILPAGGAMVSCFVRKADKSAVTVSDCSIYCAGSDVTTTYTEIGGGWYRLTGVGTSSGGAQDYGLRVQANKTIYADGFQAESKTIATPFCDGSLGTGHSWSGTAMLSTSSRTAAALAYTLATVRYDAAVTIMAWCHLQGATLHNYGYLWYVASDAYSAHYNSSVLVVGSVDCGAPPSGWFHVALVSAGDGAVEAFVNGVSKGTASISRANLSSFFVGGQTGGNQLEGLIDDFAIIGRALPDDEILSIYASNAPIFAKTSTFSFRATPQGLVWADDEGLWMRNASGSTVLGAYGGSSTKSWAGLTLDPSDVVIGDSARGGYIQWDDSAATLSVQGTITALAGSIAGVLTIGTSGEIRQGTGTLGSDYTGLRIWRDSGVGRIGGYASNTLQWYAGTDGKLYAGGGNVAINASGIAIAPNYDSTSLTFTNVGEIYALYDAGFGGTLYFRAGYNRSKESDVLLEAYSGTTVKSSLQLGANGIISAIGALSMTEMTAPSAPASNGAYIYLDDNGSGKTRLMVRFSSGSAVQLAIQP